MLTVLFVILLFDVIPSTKADIYDECAATNCLSSSSGCIKQRACDFVVGINYNYADQKLNIHLYIKDDGRLYVALGISNDAKMGDDDVISCFRTTTRNVVAYYGRTNGKSGVTTNSVIDPATTLPGFEMETTNNGLRCHWELPTQDIPTGFRFKDFDKNVTYYLFAAAGPVTNNRLGYHSTDFAVSSEKLDFGQIKTVTTTISQHLVHKVHILCMIWGWMFFLPVSILIARYYKETWAKVRFCSRRLWFILHVGTMFLGLAFCFVGYFPILVKNKASFQNPIHHKGLQIHQWVGFTAIILLILQTLSNWFRIRRPLVRALISGSHTFFGISCYVLGFFNIATAHIFTSQVLPFENNLQAVGILSIVVLILFFILLSGTYSWIDSHIGIDIWRAFCYCPMPISSNEEAPRSDLRKAVLYAFILLAFTMSLTNSALMLTWTSYKS